MANYPPKKNVVECPGDKKIPNTQEIQDFIANDKPKELIEAAEAIGCRLVQLDLTTSQIRNIFGAVRQIKMNWTIENHDRSYKQAVMLRPKIAYQAKRLKSEQLGKLLDDKLSAALDVVIKATDKEKQRDYFQNFTEFFEAIVAYHKK
jgi:CRISPR-associated protein Csm2